MFRPKDFIATNEGLVFAVVSDMIENDRVLCFLRYVRSRQKWSKVKTEQANNLLRQQHPHYLFHSEKLDARLHAVPVENIAGHYRPRQRLAELLATAPTDAVENDCRRLCRLLQRQGVALDQVGVTGSLLPGFHHAASDIDLVFYGREIFQQGRRAVKSLLDQGVCQPLSSQDWRESYQRRDCHLTLSEYVWHEQRKFNKVMFNRRKVDLNMIVDNSAAPSVALKKIGNATIRAKVNDARLAFDYPAVYFIDHAEIERVMCFTATYTGQAEADEWIEVAGQVEQKADGRRWIVVGSTREAKGEYIKVCHEN